jgi:glucokinase
MMSKPVPTPSRAIVADIGGTNARFAIADLGTLELSDIRHFPCSGHPTLAAAIADYLAGIADPPAHAAVAVAAPVTGDDVKLTNSTWSFARNELRAKVGLEDVLVLNDFEALALSLPHLAGSELHQIGGSAPMEHGTKTVLGPGTGLGVAGLVWGGNDWIAVPGEGGHVTLGAHDERELALLERLRKGREHLSAERALSGPGLSDLYLAVAAAHGDTTEALTPKEVEDRAASGADPIAEQAMDFFVTWLGRFAGDVALVYGARGGIYLGGGIPRKLVRQLASGAFRQAFEAKGRMGAFLAPIPVYVILAEFAALKGAAAGLRAALSEDAVRMSRPRVI